MLRRSSGEPSGQRRGPRKEEGLLISGWAVGPVSVPLGSGATEVEVQRCDVPFRRWVLVSPNRRSGIWWRRSKRGRGDPRMDLFLPWLWIWVRLSTESRSCLQPDEVERWRFGDVGARRRRDWASAVLGLWWGKWWLGRAPVIGLCWCFLVFSCLVSCCWFSVVVVVVVVVLLTISPSSFERGFGSFGVASMPLFWYHGGTVAPSLWLGLLAVPAVCRCDDELPSHVVWRFWDTVLERVIRFIFILVTGLYLYTRVWLLSLVARVYGRIWWLVGLVWLTEVGLFGRSATMVLVWKGWCGLIPHMVAPVLCNMLDY